MEQGERGPQRRSQPESQPGGRARAARQEMRRTADEVLADIGVWRLRASRWDVVGRGLRAMSDALAAGDTARFRRAVADVEMAGPHRISGLEDCALLPLPEEHRERLAELVHALGTDVPPATPATPAAPGGPGPDRTPRTPPHTVAPDAPG